jgi:hypothetical protein
MLNNLKATMWHFSISHAFIISQGFMQWLVDFVIDLLIISLTLLFETLFSWHYLVYSHIISSSLIETIIIVGAQPGLLIFRRGWLWPQLSSHF